MAALHDGVFTSKMHTFLVSEQTKEIKVHAEAITRHSKGLAVLINGPMPEASSGVTVLEDVLEDTFIRFCQFAYVGDYATPDFTIAPKAGELDGAFSGALVRSDLGSCGVSEAEPSVEDVIPEPPIEPMAEESVAVEEQWDRWGAIPKKKNSKKQRSKSSLLRQEFDSQIYYTKSPVTKSPCRIRGNELPEEDYTPVLLGHANLYVFAKKWGIEELKNLTLHKLHRTLVAFQVFAARRSDIIRLAKFAYSDENTPDLEGGAMDALRALVVLYVVCELEQLVECPDLLALLEQPGSFSRDLVRVLMRRIE